MDPLPNAHLLLTHDAVLALLGHFDRWVAVKPNALCRRQWNQVRLARCGFFRAFGCRGEGLLKLNVSLPGRYMSDPGRIIIGLASLSWMRSDRYRQDRRDELCVAREESGRAVPLCPCAVCSGRTLCRCCICLRVCSLTRCLAAIMACSCSSRVGLRRTCAWSWLCVGGGGFFFRRRGIHTRALCDVCVCAHSRNSCAFQVWRESSRQSLVYSHLLLRLDYSPSAHVIVGTRRKGAFGASRGAVDRHERKTRRVCTEGGNSEPQQNDSAHEKMSKHANQAASHLAFGWLEPALEGRWFLLRNSFGEAIRG